MCTLIAVRREDKNQWERRTPLIPDDLANLQQRYPFRFLVQPSAIRIYADEEYRSAGIAVDEELSPAAIVFADKEVPVHCILPGKIYVFFAHVAKGQLNNMPMLKRLIEQGCSLVDYEKVVDDQNRRLIFFGRHAGYAGMIETLWCLGQRLAVLGEHTPLAEVKHAYEYEDLKAAEQHLHAIGEQLAHYFRTGKMRQLVVGFSGYGNVSSGAQEVFDCLQPTAVAVSDLPAAAQGTFGSGKPLIKVVFREEDMVQPKEPDRQFILTDYYQNPDRYVGCFEKHLPYLDVLVNAIYWEPCYPRLITREWADHNYLRDATPRLKVIGDISCDIQGSVELTVKATEPDHPSYIYSLPEHCARDDFEGTGPVIVAVDNLPCELARESSQYFSSVLRDFLPVLAAADWHADFESLDLPSYLKRAVVVHKGALTPSFYYLKEHLEVARNSPE